jgi:hypothetical protein
MLENMLLLSIQGPLLFYNVALLGRTLRSMASEELARLQHSPAPGCPNSALMEMAALANSHDALLGASAASGRARSRTPSSDGDEDGDRTSASGILTHPRPPRRHFLLFDLSPCTDMDTSSLLLLQKTILAIQHEGSEVLLCGLRPRHAALVERSGLLDRVRLSKPDAASSASGEGLVAFEGLHQAVLYAQAQQT